MSLLGDLFGVPISHEERERTFANFNNNRTAHEAADYLRSGVYHNTEKAGALLAAQGIFAVAGTFALDHGWPKYPVLAAMFLLFLGSLFAMSILRSTMGMYRHAMEAVDPVRLIFNLALARTIRFNIALYMTVLSILLLAGAALSFV